MGKYQYFSLIQNYNCTDFFKEILSNGCVHKKHGVNQKE